MRWKWACLGVVVLVMAAMVTVYAVLASYDYNSLKPRMARMVKDATGRELKLGGEVGLTMGFPPTLVVRDAVFANAPWGSQPQMIQVDTLQVEVRLLPLLAREVVVTYVGLSGVQVLLETDSSGKGNWEFTADRPPEMGDGKFQSLGIAVDQLRIEDLRLTYRRAGAAAHYTIEHLDVARQEAVDRLAIDLQAHYNEIPVALSGQTGGLRTLRAHKRFPLELSGTFARAKVEVAGAIDDILTLRGITLKTHISGTDLAALGIDTRIPLPETSAFDATGLLKGSKASLALEGLTGNFSGRGMDLAFSGNVGDLFAFSAVDLKLNGSGQDLSTIGPIIGQNLPTTDQFAFHGYLRGAAKNLSFEEAQASAGRGSLKIDLNGEVKDLLSIKGVDAQVEGSGKNLAEIAPLIGVKLPVTDDFAFEGRLRGSPERLSLGEAKANAGQGDLHVVFKGEVGDVLDFSGLDLQVKVAGKDLTEMAPIIGVTLPATDGFAVEGRLKGSAKTLRLTAAQGQAKRGRLDLTLDGQIQNLLTLDGVDLNAQASGTELAEIGPLVGTALPELGPFDMSAKLAGSPKAISLSDVSAIVDKSDFKGQAQVVFRKRPKITIRLDSSVIDFSRLMNPIDKNAKKLAANPSPQRHLFPDDPLPFDVLKKVDADIRISARNIHARDARLEFGHLTLKLENGDFSIDKLEAAYKKTKISGHLAINDGAPPHVAVNFLVQGFDLGDFLKEIGQSDDKVRAIIDIAAYGESRGDSVNRLMANLNGSIGAVMGKGYLTRYLDMLSMNLSQKVLSFWDWARHHREKANQINCAVVQFDIKEGIATSKAFVFDSQLAVLTGEGQINMGTEQIDFLLVPDAKNPSLLSLSTNLRVRGPLWDPTVRPDKLSLLTQGSWALSSLAIGPLGLLAPFVHLGAFKAHPCDVPGIGYID